MFTNFLACLFFVVLQVAKVFASEPGADGGGDGGGGGGGAGGPKRKASMATNTLATKFKGSLTTLMWGNVFLLCV